MPTPPATRRLRAVAAHACPGCRRSAACPAASQPASSGGRPSPYDILQVPADASEADIKKAYRRAAVRWHPDKNADNVDEAEKKFKQIGEAYSILSDSKQRAIYDRYGYDGLSQAGGGGSGSPGSGGGSWQPFHSGSSMPGFGGAGGGADPFDIFRQFFGDEVSIKAQSFCRASGHCLSV
eukprot:SAG22_NODE_188_length_15821_cov_38.313319_23_plen_180_part_00